ncbi:MAG: hypothetical protein ACYS0K_24460, partial [Planctomycetota bacterium]
PSTECFIPTPPLINKHVYLLEVEMKNESLLPAPPSTMMGDPFWYSDAFSNDTVVEFTVPEPESTMGALVAFVSLKLLAVCRRLGFLSGSS